MSGSAIAMMVIGIIIIWGGLVASIVHARNVAKKNNE